MELKLQGFLTLGRSQIQLTLVQQQILCNIVVLFVVRIVSKSFLQCGGIPVILSLYHSDLNIKSTLLKVLLLSLLLFPHADQDQRSSGDVGGTICSSVFRHGDIILISMFQMEDASCYSNRLDFVICYDQKQLSTTSCQNTSSRLLVKSLQICKTKCTSSKKNVLDIAQRQQPAILGMCPGQLQL